MAELDHRDGNNRALVSWSGGKDSCLSFFRSKNEGTIIKLLITSMDETGTRARSHGVPPTLLSAQATSLGVDIRFYHTSWETYESLFVETLRKASVDYGLRLAVYGDIDIPSHREWEEKVSNLAGLTAVLPLWNEPRLSLVNEFIDSGFKAIVVCIDGSVLSKDYCGRLFDHTFVRDLPPGVDACGENGEFHTFVFDGPCFEHPVLFDRVEVKTYTAPAEYGGKTFFFQVIECCK